MSKVLISFFKKPSTIIGVLAAIMFQLIFSIVWMTGYAGVSERIDKMTIGIVNEDSILGNDLQAQISEQIPFQVKAFTSLELAKEELNQRQVYMILRIPSTFTEELQSPGQATLHFILNESNSQMVQSVMNALSASMASNINKQSVIMGLQAFISENEQVPIEQSFVLAERLAERVISEEEIINPVASFSSQMIPLMLVLASYVGAMIMSMNVQQSAALLRSSLPRWQSFLARGIINVAAAVIVGLVGSTMIHILGAPIKQGFLVLWAFQSLFMMSFLFIAQIFLILFGTAGMLVNIIILSVQLVSSGAMIPRDLLSDFYFKLSEFLPATYAVDGMMYILFGAANLSADVWALFWITLGAIGIGALAAALPLKKVPQAKYGQTLKNT